ncbi:MAG: carboxylesterase [Gammaproteobacteria bacterium]|nr:MAG: carboxylesterase [Gammaproteobacteria bacterium]
MDWDKPPPLVLEPDGPVRGAVIWLHGLGADGRDFAPVMPELGLLEAGLRVLLPHAPVQPVTLNGGLPMRAWYDIRLPDLERAVDCAGIEASVDYVRRLLATQEADGLPARNLVVGGFSQGGVIALHTGLRCPSLAGILALSCYLPCRDGLPRCHPHCPPVFLAHGLEDPIVPYAAGESAAAWLRGQGIEVDWYHYPMGHGVVPDELAALRAWIARRILPRLERESKD